MSLLSECLSFTLGNIQDSRTSAKWPAGLSLPCPMWALVASCGCASSMKASSRGIYLCPILLLEPEEELAVLVFRWLSVDIAEMFSVSITGTRCLLCFKQKGWKTATQFSKYSPPGHAREEVGLTERAGVLDRRGTGAAGMVGGKKTSSQPFSECCTLVRCLQATLGGLRPKKRGS